MVPTKAFMLAPAAEHVAVVPMDPSACGRVGSKKGPIIKAKEKTMSLMEMPKRNRDNTSGGLRHDGVRRKRIIKTMLPEPKMDKIPAKHCPAIPAS